MKRAALIAMVFIFAAAACALAQGGQNRLRYGGFDVTIEHTAPGVGTFSIAGENPYGTVDVSGTFEVVVDPETKVVSVHVVFDEGSTVVCPDGTVNDLSGQEFWYESSASMKKVCCAIINWIKTLCEE